MTDKQNDTTALAFEYVLGTLRESERDAFEQAMQRNYELRDAVSYWENALVPETCLDDAIAPHPDTFKHIQQRIQNTRSSSSYKLELSGFLNSLLSWKTASFALFALVLILGTLHIPPTTLPQTVPTNSPSDYVAVLLNNDNAPVLTALTTANESVLFLKWEEWQPLDNQSLQLWSQSRRDGEIRPLMVFNSEPKKTIEIDEATLRLIKDSSYLLITLEELGGSPLDEPSDIVLAKGVCVRLTAPDNSTKAV
jgi:anti-sigma-K factor RskA